MVFQKQIKVRKFASLVSYRQPHKKIHLKISAAVSYRFGRFLVLARRSFLFNSGLLNGCETCVLHSNHHIPYTEGGNSIHSPTNIKRQSCVALTFASCTSKLGEIVSTSGNTQGLFSSWFLFILKKQQCVTKHGWGGMTFKEDICRALHQLASIRKKTSNSLNYRKVLQMVDRENVSWVCPMNSVNQAGSKNDGCSFVWDADNAWIDCEHATFESCSKFQDHRTLLHHSRNSSCSANPVTEPWADSVWKDYYLSDAWWAHHISTVELYPFPQSKVFLTILELLANPVHDLPQKLETRHFIFLKELHCLRLKLSPNLKKSSI